MLLWDGTEERDFMLDPPKWNWLARTNDFQQTELQGGAGAERSYSPVELLEPECFRFMKDKFTGYYREFGIRFVCRMRGSFRNSHFPTRLVC